MLEELVEMNQNRPLNDVLIRRTKRRLRVSRLFGLSILLLLVFGSSYWCSSPLVEQTLFMAGLLLAVIGYCGRVWCHCYITGRKKRVLVTTGPYSICRHPLYFFSLVGGIGLGLCTETLIAAILFAIAFTLYYPHVIRGEEAFMSRNFSDYESYQTRVPLFFPRWSSLTEGEFMMNGVQLRREIIAGSGFLLSIGVFEFLEGLHKVRLLPTYFLIP